MPDSKVNKVLEHLKQRAEQLNNGELDVRLIIRKGIIKGYDEIKEQRRFRENWE